MQTRDRRPARPNILLITADQWRGDAIACAGHPRLRTPNIDALAAEGTRFARHYAQATPCSPARASLYTGLYQMTTRVVRNGTPLDDRHDNIARMLRRAGYDPTLLGYTDQAIDPRTTSGDDPWLTTFEGVLPGFTARVRLPEDNGPWLSWLRARGHAIPDDPWDIYLPASGASPRPSTAPPRYGEDETETAFITDEALRFLGEQPPGRPWFVARLLSAAPSALYRSGTVQHALRSPRPPSLHAQREGRGGRGPSSARRLLARDCPPRRAIS